MGFILKWILRWLLEGFAALFELIGAVTNSCFDNVVIKSILQVFQTIGLPIVGLSILVLMLKTVLAASDGEKVSIADVGKRCCFGIVVYVYGVKIVQLFYQCTLDVCHKLITAILNFSEPNFNDILNWLDTGLTSLVLIIIMIYYMFKVILELTERFWQLMVMLCMMYIYLPSYIAGDDESIAIWFKQSLAIILTQVFQSVLLTTGMSIFITSDSPSAFYLTLGALVAASKVEQLLDRYGMAVGGKVGGVMRNGMSVAFYAKSIFR